MRKSAPISKVTGKPKRKYSRRGRPAHPPTTATVTAPAPGVPIIYLTIVYSKE